MDERRFDAITRLVAQLASRRSAVLLLGGAGVASALSSLIIASTEIDAKKRRKKKNNGKKKRNKHTCKSPKGTCGGMCVPLDTNENCGRCGNACAGVETCRDGVCCAQPLCRGECRAECPGLEHNVPFPQARDYGNGSIKPTYPQARLNGDVEAAYDRWKARYLVSENRAEEGHQIFRIALGRPGTGNHEVTVSEGQGFGMILMATMAGYEEEARAIFDGLWRFRLAHPSRIDPRLMDWRVPSNGGDDSAFDGDADIAYGLLLADAQWGSAGLIDYLAEAQTVIAGIKASTIGPDSNLPMLGDWVDPNGSPYNQNTLRTSDFMPGHFKAFGAATGDSVWDDVTGACQGVIDTLQQGFSQNATGDPPLTGLLPDFAIRGEEGFRPAPCHFLEPNACDYNYNAGRDPWRLGTDALLNDDPISRAQAALIAQWANAATGGEATAIKGGYKLDGTPLASYFTTFFAAPIGVAAMTDASLQSWLNAIYDAVHDVQEDYYEDTVTLLCLLVMTGNFWAPWS